MFDCKRCHNRGWIMEQYVDMGLPPTPNLTGPIDMTPTPIKERKVECPECLGFSAVPLRPREP